MGWTTTTLILSGTYTAPYVVDDAVCIQSQINKKLGEIEKVWLKWMLMMTMFTPPRL